MKAIEFQTQSGHLRVRHGDTPWERPRLGGSGNAQHRVGGMARQDGDLPTSAGLLNQGRPADRLQLTPESIQEASIEGKVWEVGTPSHPSCGDICFSSNGQKIARVDQSHVVIFDVHAGTSKNLLDAEAPISGIAFLDHSRVVATCRDECLYVGSVDDEGGVSRLDLNDQELGELAISTSLAGTNPAPSSFQQICTNHNTVYLD